MTKVYPLNDFVLIQPIDTTTEQTPGGIFIPETAREKPSSGRIIAIGAHVDLPTNEEANVLQEGKTVIFDKHGATEITIDNVPHVLVKAEDLFAIQVEEENSLIDQEFENTGSDSH